MQRNADLLDGVETRAQQTTPYLKNLLALSAALQDKYTPQSLNEPVAARILFVSDVHGAQQYPLMKAIVDEEQIDAVIDLGDLVNFGSVTEAETVGLFKGIESLGVPYLFVRGNHDASAAGDTALLDRLAKVPNVVLLAAQPRHLHRAHPPRPAHRRLQRPAVVRRRQPQQRRQAGAGSRGLRGGVRRPAAARPRRLP